MLLAAIFIFAIPFGDISGSPSIYYYSSLDLWDLVEIKITNSQYERKEALKKTYVAFRGGMRRVT